MARKRRELSKSGLYHIVIEGYNKADIFMDELDKEKFIDILQTHNLLSKFRLHDYCIMSDHAHLVIHDYENMISKIMKEITSKYAYYINNKYKRTGKVFHDRFKSEPIENTSILPSLSAFIHNNLIETNNYNFIDGTDNINISKLIQTEQDAKEFVQNYLLTKNLPFESIQTNWQLRFHLVRELKEKSNLSIRKIASLLSLTRGIVQNIK